MTSYLSAAGVLAVLVLIPGPDTAVVTKFVLTAGRGPGYLAAAGVVAGMLTWGVLTAAGLAALLAASASVYEVVKLAGAAYLVVLGLRMLWRARRRTGAAGAAMPEGHRHDRRPVRAGLLTNLLNPKAAVIYTSLLPSLIPHGANPHVWLPLLVATLAVLSLTWLTVFVTLAARSRSVLSRPRARQWLERVTGAVLIGLGLRVAAEAR